MSERQLTGYHEELLRNEQLPASKVCIIITTLLSSRTENRFLGYISLDDTDAGTVTSLGSQVYCILSLSSLMLSIASTDGTWWLRRIVGESDRVIPCQFTRLEMRVAVLGLPNQL